MMDLKGGYVGMKKLINAMFVLLLAAALAGAAVSPASADIEESGWPRAPYWFETITAGGKFIDKLDNLYQNSAQYVMYNTDDPENPKYIFIAHPNYLPIDDQTTAVTTIAVTGIQVYDPYSYNPGYVDCLVGATFQVPASFVQWTNGTQYDLPYLQFEITFTIYDNYTGEATEEPPVVAYFNFEEVQLPPGPAPAVLNP
jgi:hypothetical protein